MQQRPRTALPLKQLLRKATPEQVARARNTCIDHFNACHRAGLHAEDPDRIMFEALKVAMLDGEPETVWPLKRERLESRDYRAIYSGSY